MKKIRPDHCPKSEEELIEQCHRIEGLSLSQLAAGLGLVFPGEQTRRKGWTGLAIELALGATAGSKSIPDFCHLGIELKTIPLNKQGNPAESTFVTSIPLLTVHRQQWLTSQCCQKLRRVLWIPVEGDKMIPFEHRRIGRAMLWSPTTEQETILSKDWEELTTMISTGQLEEINAAMGDYLQVRPKAANTQSLCYGFDSEGNKILTLPRGFYLRACFTKQLLGC
ncbi:DNA mismatch repair endonuclease MutH [Legionella spiritensis]|uniref:DNA mismatch repair endonuclease MutH n=1 Tax=Legionella spiritensis TaxID=452 RepID=UPI000F6CEE53|nr:DNA mismatch repair endonuclease MutH [Legionella spiritensis]VEG90112.1 DNA mismatch repair protein MutH [Legionella spiritensis]